jgi:Glycosyl hydrolase family 12
MHRSTFGLIVGSLFTVGLLVGCATPASTGGGSGGNGTASGGNNGSGQGGSTANGGTRGTSSGGSSGTSSGGSSGTGSGGSSATGSGGSGSGSTCTPMPSQLVNTSAYNCDQTTSIGIEGSIYPYGDGSSCPYGPTSPPTNICTGSSGCCLSGTTVVDSTFAKWGCGIGLELDDDGTTKNVYMGSVKCFMISLTGSSGNNVVRIGFTQSAMPASGAVAPYTEIPAFTNNWSGQVCFADATCPGWATAMQCSTTNSPVDMQIQVSAGSTTSTTGAYNLCLTSVVPVGSTSTGTGGSGGGTSSCGTPTGSGTLTGQYDTAHVGCPKDYIVQNNDWGVSSVSQTITYGPGTKFKVATQTGTGANGAPASYPDIFIGSNGNHTSTSSGLPLPVSQISATGIQTSWTWDDSAVSASGSSYNAAYDVWFSSGTGGDPASATAPSAGYLMVWFYKPSDNQPIGSTITNGSVMIGGKQFNIWYGTNTGDNKPVVSYVAQEKMTSWSFSLGAFIQDAIGRTCSGSTKCLAASGGALTNVFSGFEIWKGGVGLQTTDFGVTVP